MIGYIKENPHCHKCEHCENTHRIKDLNDKLDEYFCTLSCRIAKHASDLDIHVTDDEKAYWDAKAEQSSVDALNDNMENVLDKLEKLQDLSVDLDKFVTKDYLKDFVTKDYVNEYVNTVISGYDFATKEYVKTYIDGAFDPTNYYTKFQVDSLLSKNIKDYTITSVNYSDGTLTINQGSVSNSKSVYIGKNSGSGDNPSSSMTQDVFDDMLRASKTIHTLTINNKLYNPILADVEMNITGGSGSGSSDGGGYYKPYFKNATYYDSFPKSEMPTDGQPPSVASGWTEQQKNPASGQYTWMTQVFIDSAGNYGSYMDPIRLTGEKGSAGEDGSTYEYIYRRQNQNETLPSKPDNKQQDGYIPSGWNDHPEGVDLDHKYEYVCYRIKNKDGQWGDWFGPYLWSAYGINGTDGDGVEYIYYVGFVKPTGSLQDPSQWDTTVKEFQNNEYILSGSGWTDDPVDLTEQGQKQYVSVRKKRDGKWGPYSEPALWSYYSVDGKADSIMMRVDGENQYVPLNSDSTNKLYTASIPVYMYNNSDTISFDLNLIGAYDSNGTTNASLATSVNISSLSSGNGKSVNINLANRLISFDGIYYTLRFKATSTSGSTYVDRIFTINLFGVNTNVAKDAETYSLKTNSHVVKYEDGAFYPNTLSCYVLKSVGDNLTEIHPSESGTGWVFKYNVDSNTNVALNSDSLTLSNILSSTSNSIQFIATNGYGITLSENIPVVKSGVPGLNGVSYSTEASNISYTYKPKDDKDNQYDLTFKSDIKLIKRQGSTQEYLSLDDYYLKYSYESITQNTGITNNTSSKSRTISFSDTVSVSSTVVQIYAYEQGTDAILSQLLIPISSVGKKGIDGDSSSQTLVGSPLRIVEWVPGKKYYDGKRAAEDGVFYQDVVLYNNVYYACINTETGEKANWVFNPDDATYFSAFSLTEDQMVNLLIANKAFIKELTSNEVVIMDDDDIVAGMTSGTKKENSPLNGNIDNVGDVRIWAGKPRSTGDLTTAPFTVTHEGVVTSIGEHGTIQIKDGTIYFINGSQIFYLAIIDGKPNWTTGSEVIGSTQYTFYTFSGSDGQIQPVSHSLFQSDGDKKYYTSSNLTTLYTGEYYKEINGIYNSFIYSIGGNVYLATNSGNISGIVKMYQKMTFTNGVASFGQAYALGRSIVNNSAIVDGGTGTATINTTGYSHLYFHTMDSSSLRVQNLAYPGTVDKLNLNYTMYSSSNYTLNKGTVDTIYYVSTTSKSGTEYSKTYTTVSLLDVEGNINLVNNSTLQIIGDVTLS